MLVSWLDFWHNFYQFKFRFNSKSKSSAMPAKTSINYRNAFGNSFCSSTAWWARRGSSKWSTRPDTRFWWTSTAASRPATMSASSWSIYRAVISWSTSTTTSSPRPRPGSHRLFTLVWQCVLRCISINVSACDYFRASRSNTLTGNILGKYQFYLDWKWLHS